MDAHLNRRTSASVEGLTTRLATQATVERSGQWIAILGVGILVTVVVAATYVRSLGAEFDVGHARAMAIVALTAASAGITAGLSGLRGRMARILVLATLLLSLLLVQVPQLAALLHLRPLH
jgi:Ca2+-transporting ATPase